MDNFPHLLMDFGTAFAGIVTDNPIMLVLGVAMAMAIWRFSGKPARQD